MVRGLRPVVAEAVLRGINRRGAFGAMLQAVPFAFLGIDQVGADTKDQHGQRNSATGEGKKGKKGKKGRPGPPGPQGPVGPKSITAPLLERSHTCLAPANAANTCAAGCEDGEIFVSCGFAGQLPDGGDHSRIFAYRLGRTGNRCGVAYTNTSTTDAGQVVVTAYCVPA